jgi:hypothetical protein
MCNFRVIEELALYVNEIKAGSQQQKWNSWGGRLAIFVFIVKGIQDVMKESGTQSFMRFVKKIADLAGKAIFFECSAQESCSILSVTRREDEDLWRRPYKFWHETITGHLLGLRHERQVMIGLWWAECVFILEHYFTSKSSAAVREAFSSAYPTCKYRIEQYTDW